MTDEPIFVMDDPEAYAQRVKERLLALGCSEEYAERDRMSRVERLVRVSSPSEWNDVLCKRGSA